MDYLLSLEYGEIAKKMKCCLEQFGAISMDDLDSEFPFLKVLSYCLEKEFAKLQEENK